MKSALFKALAVAAILAAGAIMLFCCYAAASDAQGAILFIFGGPIVVLLLVGAWFAGRRMQRGGSGRTLTWISGSGLAFVIAFFVCSFVPGLRVFPTAVIGVVASTYEAVTGLTPYAAAHQGNDIPSLVRAELATARDGTLDLGRLSTTKNWDRVCVFGPYTSNAAAAPVLGLDNWDIEMYSGIAASETIATLVFIDGKQVAYVAEIPRSEADFARLTLRCFARSKAIFERVPEARTPEFRPRAWPRVDSR